MSINTVWLRIIWLEERSTMVIFQPSLIVFSFLQIDYKKAVSKDRETESSLV